MSIYAELKRVKDQVLFCLKTYEPARNSDKELFIKVCQAFYNAQSRITWAEFFELPNYESVRRMRQKIQEEGHYPPTDWHVAQERGYLYDDWRKALGYAVQPSRDQGDFFMPADLTARVAL
jgi:hypothetical protein